MLETLLIARAVLYGRPVRLHAPRNHRNEPAALPDPAVPTKRQAFFNAARKMSQLVTARGRSR